MGRNSLQFLTDSNSLWYIQAYQHQQVFRKDSVMSHSPIWRVISKGLDNILSLPTYETNVDEVDCVENKGTQAICNIVERDAETLMYFLVEQKGCCEERNVGQDGGVALGSVKALRDVRERAAYEMFIRIMMTEKSVMIPYIALNYLDRFFDTSHVTYPCDIISEDNAMELNNLFLTCFCIADVMEDDMCWGIERWVNHVHNNQGDNGEQSLKRKGVCFHPVGSIQTERERVKNAVKQCNRYKAIVCSVLNFKLMIVNPLVYIEKVFQPRIGKQAMTCYLGWVLFYLCSMCVNNKLSHFNTQIKSFTSCVLALRHVQIKDLEEHVIHVIKKENCAGPVNKMTLLYRRVLL